MHTPQADDVVLADTKEKEKAERTPVGPHHVLRWFGEVATHVKTQVDKVGLVNSLAACGLVSSRVASTGFSLPTECDSVVWVVFRLAYPPPPRSIAVRLWL